MNRRQFLRNAIIGTAVIPLGGWLVYALKKTTPEHFLARVVREELPYLQINDDILEQFSIDAYRQLGKLQLSESQVGMLNIAVSFEDWVDAAGWFAPERKLLRDHIARNFLLATDFFQQGADITKTLRYLGIYDQTQRLCQHPFIRFE